MADTGDELAAALYALPVGEFTAARDRAAAGARQDGDRALAARIRKLRRPTAAAHAVNLLARAHPADLTGLLELGRALRTAQRDGDGPALRELSARRHRTITVLTALAVRDAAARGEQVSEAQQREVERTLRAATADEGAARQVTAGCLAAALDEMPAGLPAAPGPTPGGNGSGRATPSDESAAEEDQERRRTADRAARAAARAALDRATAELDAANTALSDLTRQRADLTGRRERAEQAVAEAAQALRAAEDGLLTARQDEDRLRGKHGQAARRAEAAKARAEAAQRALDELDGA